MKGNYRKVPDSTKKIRFPEPRKEPNQYREPIGPRRPSVGERILTAAGDFNRAIAPHLEQGKRTGGKVQRYAATRSRAIDHNFGIGQFNPNVGAGLMDMQFGGFGRVAAPPAPRRRSRKSRQRDEGGWGWGMPLY